MSSVSTVSPLQRDPTSYYDHLNSEWWTLVSTQFTTTQRESLQCLKPVCGSRDRCVEKRKNDAIRLINAMLLNGEDPGDILTNLNICGCPEYSCAC